MSQQQVFYTQISGSGSSNGQVLVANGTGGVNWGFVSASASQTYLLDDISDRFNGIATSFPLTINNGTPVYPSTPQLLNIFIGNVPVRPTRYITTDYQNLPEVKLFNTGFYVTGSNVVFATPPLYGMSFAGTYFSSSDPSSLFTYKQTPFTALNIMLGA